MKKSSFFSALILSIKVWAFIFFAACLFITSLCQPTFALAAGSNNLNSLNEVALVKGSKVSTDATLSALTTTAGTISPVFAPGTIAYTAGVGNAQSSITVTPTANDGGTIEIRVNGGGFGPVTSGNASAPLALNVGTNTVEVKVTATDGLTVITYTITVTRFNDITITSFSPLSGPIGTAVTITGKNFNTTPGNNIVFFGATRGTVTNASATSLTVIVPAGLTYSSLTVLNTGTKTSAQST
ncbi:MAG: cadherin-like beta sandwich domain-containing protein [Bacteroidia bacterium]